TVRERNAAIWSRFTESDGEYVVAVVPVVIPRVNASTTNGQSAASLTSRNGPHTPRSNDAAPGNAAARRRDLARCVFMARRGQNRASPSGGLITPWRVTQKFRPSLHAPRGWDPIGNDPAAVMSAAFHRETLPPLKFVTRTRWPSNAAENGEFNPLPVRVARSAALEARTTASPSPPSGTQRFVPSNAGLPPPEENVRVWRIAPLESSL